MSSLAEMKWILVFHSEPDKPALYTNQREAIITYSLFQGGICKTLSFQNKEAQMKKKSNIIEKEKDQKQIIKPKKQQQINERKIKWKRRNKRKKEEMSVHT